MYVLGSPICQDWRHVYTAVTRGVRQVIVVHDPDHLRKVVMENEPFPRNTKLKEFLTEDLATPSDVTTCPKRDENDDDGFYSQILHSEYSASGHPAAGGSLDVPSSTMATSTTSASNYISREDEFKDQCDYEVLAWALESSQQQVNQEVNNSCRDPQGLSLENVNTESSEYLLERTDPESNAITDGHFQIARTTFDIKKKKRYTVDCRMEPNSHSSAARDGSQSAEFSGNFLASSHGVRVKLERQDEAGGGVVECSSGQFSGSLCGLALSGRNNFSSAIDQCPPATNSTSVLDSNSPKACYTRFSEGSGFPTPPQTPPNVRMPTSSLPNHRSNTFPRESVSQRTQFIKLGGTPAKRKRTSITARYNNWCRLCKKSIRAGVDKITRLDNGSAKPWVHLTCAQYN